MRAGHATSEWSVQAQHDGPSGLCGRLASCQWPLRSVAAIQIGRTCRSTALTHIPIALSSDRSICLMPLIQYFLYVGSALSLLLLGLSVYLEPPGSGVQASPPSVNVPGVFRPTPAPPIVEAKRLRVRGTVSTANARSSQVAKIAPAKQKKQGTQVARRRVAPDRTFAYFPRRPFFFVWR